MSNQTLALSCLVYALKFGKMRLPVSILVTFRLYCLRSKPEKLHSQCSVKIGERI